MFIYHLCDAYLQSANFCTNYDPNLITFIRTPKLSARNPSNRGDTTGDKHTPRFLHTYPSIPLTYILKFLNIPLFRSVKVTSSNFKNYILNKSVSMYFAPIRN